MEDELSNLITISKNKYNIDLLETIEHKELFSSIPKFNKNTSSKKNKSTNKISNNSLSKNKNINSYYIINEENNTLNFPVNDKNDVINDNNITNASPEITNKAKINSNNFKNYLNNKIEFFQRKPKSKSLITKNKNEADNNNHQKKPEYDCSYDRRDNENQQMYINKYNNEFSFTRKKNKKYKKMNNNKNLVINNITADTSNIISSYEKNNPLFLRGVFSNNNSTFSKKNLLPKSKNCNINTKNNLDIYSRLYNKQINNKKQNLTQEKNNKELCAFKPVLDSQLKLKTSLKCYDNFIKRQESFNKYLMQKKICLTNDIIQKENKKFTFTPNTSCTSNSKYSIKLEAQRCDESSLDKANRMVYDSVKKIEEKNNELNLLYNERYSFTPLINKNHKITRSLSFFTPNKKIKNFIIKEKEHSEKQIKYVNHQYDYIKSCYKNDDDLMKRLVEEKEKRTKKIDNIRKEKDDELHEKCTFKPKINKVSEHRNTYSNKNITRYNCLVGNSEGNDNYIHNDDNHMKNRTYVDLFNKKLELENRNNRNSNKNNYGSGNNYDNNLFNCCNYNEYNNCANNCINNFNMNDSNNDYNNDYNNYNNDCDNYNDIFNNNYGQCNNNYGQCNNNYRQCNNNYEQCNNNFERNDNYEHYKNPNFNNDYYNDNNYDIDCDQINENVNNNCNCDCCENNIIFNNINDHNNYYCNYNSNKDNYYFNDYDSNRYHSTGNVYKKNLKKNNRNCFTPCPKKIKYRDDKFKAVKEIKNKDKKNFLIIHKLLYDN